MLGAFLSKYVANKVEEDVIEGSKKKAYFQHLVRRSKTSMRTKNGKRATNIDKVSNRKHHIKLV